MDDSLKESIEKRVAEYRALAEARREIDEQMSALKTTLQPLLIELDDNWLDESGYARIAHRPEYPSYNSRQVETLVQAWQASSNSIMQSCAEMLLKHRKVVKSSSFLQIK